MSYSQDYLRYGLCTTDEDHRLHGKRWCSRPARDRAVIDARVQAHEKQSSKAVPASYLSAAAENRNIVIVNSFTVTGLDNGQKDAIAQEYNTEEDANMLYDPTPALRHTAELEAAEALLLLRYPPGQRGVPLNKLREFVMGDSSCQQLTPSTPFPVFQHPGGVPLNILGSPFQPPMGHNSPVSPFQFPVGNNNAQVLPRPRPRLSHVPTGYEGPTFQQFMSTTRDAQPPAAPGRVSPSHRMPAYEGPTYPPPVPLPQLALITRQPLTLINPLTAVPAPNIPPPPAPVSTHARPSTATTPTAPLLPHACPSCGKAYAERKSLSYHMHRAKSRCTDPPGLSERVKEERFKPFKCEGCVERYQHESQLRKHREVTGCGRGNAVEG
ncbi:uncharacterized protein BDZ99DRAFT_524099 [Mytilinidion resinicola]|uniref:C2H2-type domain-containing protein n=1 Tax=Mytilinidion resinicola TaxID=574789 RepID=A0A6A6YAK7_9PEZI|nr:uncharacterized protein BDZ99DRAFT_524099 [Mytilinidion resinicola]KAF2805856.1 hypothetical protein BDZ99DRAFT_524099 [Mytilinidion resinicola]